MFAVAAGGRSYEMPEMPTEFSVGEYRVVHGSDESTARTGLGPCVD